MPGAPLVSPGLGLGERLRSARKARALSVEQVADSLRLQEASVVALEEGRFQDMGAPVFVRGHLRRYAQLVGLSPEAVLEAYRAAAPGSDAPPSISRPRRQADAVRVPSWAYWLGAVLILVGLALALRDGADDRPPPAVGPAPAMAPAAVEPQPTAEPADETPAPAVTGNPRLVLQFSEDSWVEIDDSERRVVYGLQRQGSRQEVEVKPPLAVMLGNARGVAITLDGAPVAIPRDKVSNNVARFSIPDETPAAPAPESVTGETPGGASQ